MLIEVRDVLHPLWFATYEASADKHVTLSKCSPLNTNRLNPITTVGQDLKKRLMAEIKQIFSNIESVKVYHIATLLDPRYKKVGFQSILNCSRAITSVSSLIREQVKVSQNLAVECDCQLAIDDQQTSDKKKNFWDFLDLEAQSSNHYQDNDEAGGVSIELRQFLNRPLVDRNSTQDPLLVWKSIENEYPQVSTIAKRYLSIVASSTPCERLFSHTGLIANQIRSRLTPEHLNMLLFLKSVPESLWFS
ncbi:Protein of unknown function [Cotesia congregata]|uniref:HAT C-terminal dimerisation domain-containing protein n=1 Tax=Cotesia congregata TaxID=51543 RepID=A0A8J2MRK6_COTCN|nr:Protein of unknown function [Cotesia congregata]